MHDEIRKVSMTSENALFEEIYQDREIEQTEQYLEDAEFVAEVTSERHRRQHLQYQRAVRP
jgi:hypothetical protein